MKLHGRLLPTALARSLCAGAVLCLLGIVSALAQNFPTKPIRLLTPYAPGGSTDVLSRIVSPGLSQALGVPVLVENMAGANGAIGLTYLSKSPPDGHTILISSTSPIVINPHTYPNIPYDTLTAFTPIAVVATTESAIMVNPSVPANNLKELIELAKKRPVNVGVAGAGGQPELLLKKINVDTGANFVVVPFAGGGPAVTATAGGHVDAVLNDIASTIVPMVASGRLKGVVVLENKDKSEFLSATTTVKVQGYPYANHSWLVLLGPPGMPIAVAEKLRKTMADVVAQEDVVTRMRAAALLPAVSKSVADAKEFVAREYEFFRVMQKETGVKVQ